MLSGIKVFNLFVSDHLKHIFKLFKGAKFDYDQIKEENVIGN